MESHTKTLVPNNPRFEVIVDGLLPVMNALLHVFSLFQIGEASRILAALGMLSNIPIINFSSLMWSKMGLQ